MVAQSGTSGDKPLLNVIAIGGAQQFAHFIPVACSLADRSRMEVRVFVPDKAEAATIVAMAQSLGLMEPDVVEMDLPAAVAGFVPVWLNKVARLLFNNRVLRKANAILCAERTSTLLKWLPGRKTRMIHIPHGAGDRAVGFEKRIALFDTLIVAGNKDRERMIAEGLVAPEHCHVAGPIKVAAMLKVASQRPPLFANARPVLLYNPHFDHKLASAKVMTEKLVAAVMGDGRFNLIIAPHVRMAANWDAARRAPWEALAVADRVVIDLGSERSIDMSYTLGSDLYIGDVSSQVYEFLVRPRPCLFVNAHDVAWQESEDYAMWHFGEVIAPDGDVIAAIDRAFARHGEFLSHQQARVRAALEGIDWDAAGNPVFPHGDPIERAAAIIEADIIRPATPWGV